MAEPRNVLGLIPARGGSRGFPQKNLALLAGRPLISHTIGAARSSRSLTRVVVSTDNDKIARAAKEAGAEVPFLRPPELATDTATALEVIRHAVEYFEAEGWNPEAIVYLQPTSPLRRVHHIDQAVDTLWQKEADSVVSVVELPHNFSPLSVMTLDEQGFLKPYDPGGASVLRRQDKPRLWARNGPAVLALRRETVMELNTLYGPKTLPLVMDQWDSIDIDSSDDLAMAEWALSRRED
ncbi:MAG: acylneuraminate cytidylyltransferase family protein [Desulfarculaceae bacterium]